jgi:DNA replication protein DnaC
VYGEPIWEEMMEFTNGKWTTMEDEERADAVPKCILHLQEKERQARETKHQQAWDRLCPPEYRNTRSEQLPNVQKFEEVQKWQYGAKGLLLTGPTRRGKTRSIWKLLERLHFDERRKILAFTPMDLKLAVATAWRDSLNVSHQAFSRCDDEMEEEWIWQVRTIDVLFLDDLDTIKFTEAVEETIYDIFEFRPTHGYPVIATVNITGRALAARMNTNGRGAKIVERIREYCQVINFT